MADIQVPQTNPNAPQVVNPFPIVDSYLNRQQAQQQLFNKAVGDVGSTYNTLRQQKIARQMDALKAVSDLYGAGGRRAVQSYGPTVNQVAGANLIQPDQSAPPVGGGGSSLGPQTPQSSAQTLAPQADQAPSPFIQASVAAGHPDLTGHVARFAAPQPSAQDVQDIQSGGKYGTTLGTVYKDLGDISMQPLNAAEKESQIRAANARFATPEQGAAIASGDPNAVSQAYGGQAPIDAYNNAAQKQMEVKKTVAGEISKEGPNSQQIGQIRQFYSDLQDALSKNPPSLTGNLSAKVNQATGGRYGSSSAADVMNAANPLATALNTELSRRFNSGEVQLLSNSLIPNAMDTQSYRAQKMNRLNNMITAMESGNDQNVRNVAKAITGGSINTKIMPIRNGSAKIPTQTNVPEGRITVVSPTGQVGHIPQSQLQAALAKGYKQQ